MPVSIRQSIILSLLLFFSIAAAAQRHEHYYIVFSARDASIRPFSLGGHAVVSWGYTDVSRVVHSKKSLGFFPGAGKNMLEAIISTKRGRLVKGYFSNSKGIYMRQLAIEVDSSIWADTQSEAANWKYQSYNLFTRNCLHFMDKVAKMSLLKCPRTHTCLFRFPLRPVKYTKRLYRKNKNRAVSLQEIHFDKK